MDCRGSLLDAFQTIATEDDPETGPKSSPPEGLIDANVLREKMSGVLSYSDLAQFLNDAGPAPNSLVDYRKFVDTMLAVKDETVKSLSRYAYMYISPAWGRPALKYYICCEHCA